MIDTSLVIPDAAQVHIARQRFSRKPKPDAKFVASLVEDYASMLPFLPPHVGTLLDIGCGMAGIDVLLRRHYPGARLWLLDADGDDPRDGWNWTLGAFSSRAAADELLAANGVKADRWIDVNTKAPLKADLVISLASWGFHYPLRTYNVTGFCIADLRKGHESRRGMLVAEHPKFHRCAWHQVGTAR